MRMGPWSMNARASPRALVIGIGNPLRSDVPDSLLVTARLMAHPIASRAWGGLLHTVRTGAAGFDAAMGTDLEAGSFLCDSACRAADENLPEAFEKAVMAKYFTSRAAVRAASDAVQIQGAAGCHASSSVSRFYRDAKIMEIIEGTT